MKNQKMKSMDVKFCPHCESENISIESNIADAHDCCSDCGFNSSKKGVVLMINFPVKSKKIKLTH